MIQPETSVGAETRSFAGSDFVSVKNLHKAYGQRKEHLAPLVVIDDATVSVGRREFVVIIGPSGCGKSTLMGCIAGLTEYDGGSITIDGEPVTGPGLQSAVVFQHASLLPWLTVQENVAYGLKMRRTCHKTEIAEKVNKAVQLVGLSGFENHYPHEISGGMQQRVNLARALVVEASLLLMDEPFGALDALTKEMMQDELSSLIGHIDRAVVFITHDIREAVYLADKVVVMSAKPGRILKEIRVSFDRPRSRELTETAEFEEIVHNLRLLLRKEESPNS